MHASSDVAACVLEVSFNFDRILDGWGVHRNQESYFVYLDFYYYLFVTLCEFLINKNKYEDQSVASERNFIFFVKNKARHTKQSIRLF